ncbi:L-serine ammonia-lyase [Telmatobacter bradus]|uniref:L-serine ammonia-lyase n=1 Tax=Telmatobacter bradus TaxID=474953 RepID=UPI003B428B9D
MTSLFDLYKIGVGPSSSHTMGPMRAACRFSSGLKASGLLNNVARIEAELYGSLALTGKGHATDHAVLLGLEANDPATINPTAMTPTIARIRHEKKIALAGEQVIEFAEERDLRFLQETMTPPGAKNSHPNGLRLRARNAAGAIVDERTYFSIGGGFITEDGEESISATTVPVPFPFHSAEELLKVAANNELTISQLMFENECALAPRTSTQSPSEFVRAGIARLWQTMQECIERGMLAEGTLPGGLNVKRRARRMAELLRTRETEKRGPSVLAPLDWLTVWAMAVNEENAAGGRVVTAPTNGAAGVVPAVAQYYQRFGTGANEDGIERFFLTSAAIGILYKENASISGAEVGCQGEVGVACSMAAAGLTAAMGGSNGEVEHAAEIAMEHNLGMTCDPIGGLVQIPCIERNAMAAAKAIHAARIAMNEGPEHKVSLDQVIRTMYLTGMDMQARYKETSLAGLALNRIEC